MAKVKEHNLKGSTFVETLVAMVIVALAFGFGVTFLSNKPYSNNLKSYIETLELREMANKNQIERRMIYKDIQIEEMVFMDSLCIIEKIALSDSSNRSIIKIKPIVK